MSLRRVHRLSNQTQTSVFPLLKSRGRLHLGANVSGTIIDANGAVVPGATVSIANSQNNFAISVSSNSEGVYQFDNLQPGTYSLKIETPGFRTLDVASVILASSADISLDHRLEVAALVAVARALMNTDEFITRE